MACQKEGPRSLRGVIENDGPGRAGPRPSAAPLNCKPRHEIPMIDEMPMKFRCGTNAVLMRDTDADELSSLVTHRGDTHGILDRGR